MFFSVRLFVSFLAIASKYFSLAFPSSFIGLRSDLLLQASKKSLFQIGPVSQSVGSFSVTVYGPPLTKGMTIDYNTYGLGLTSTMFWNAVVDHWPGDILKGPVEVNLTFYLERPPGHYSTGGDIKKSSPDIDEHIFKPDLDNLTKFVLDVLVGLAYDDDKQVVKLTAEKRYADGGKPRTEILISHDHEQERRWS